MSKVFFWKKQVRNQNWMLLMLDIYLKQLSRGLGFSSFKVTAAVILCIILGVVQQLRGPNFTQFWPPPHSSGQLWTFTWYLLFVTWPSVDFLLTPCPPPSSCPCSYWMTPCPQSTTKAFSRGLHIRKHILHIGLEFVISKNLSLELFFIYM